MNAIQDGRAVGGEKLLDKQRALHVGTKQKQKTSIVTSLVSGSTAGAIEAFATVSHSPSAQALLECDGN